MLYFKQVKLFYDEIKFDAPAKSLLSYFAERWRFLKIL